MDCALRIEEDDDDSSDGGVRGYGGDVGDLNRAAYPYMVAEQMIHKNEGLCDRTCEVPVPIDERWLGHLWRGGYMDKKEDPTGCGGSGLPVDVVLGTRDETKTIQDKDGHWSALQSASDPVAVATAVTAGDGVEEERWHDEGLIVNIENMESQIKTLKFEINTLQDELMEMKIQQMSASEAHEGLKERRRRRRRKRQKRRERRATELVKGGSADCGNSSSSAAGAVLGPKEEGEPLSQEEDREEKESGGYDESDAIFVREVNVFEHTHKEHYQAAKKTDMDSSSGSRLAYYSGCWKCGGPRHWNRDCPKGFIPRRGEFPVKGKFDVLMSEVGPTCASAKHAQTCASAVQDARDRLNSTINQMLSMMKREGQAILDGVRKMATELSGGKVRWELDAKKQEMNCVCAGTPALMQRIQRVEEDVESLPIKAKNADPLMHAKVRRTINGDRFDGRVENIEQGRESGERLY